MRFYCCRREERRRQCSLPFSSRYFPRFTPATQAQSSPCYSIGTFIRSISTTSSCTSKLIDDRGSVLLRGRPPTKVPGDRLALRDRLRISAVNNSRRTGQSQLTSRVAFSIFAAYSFRFMCLKRGTSDQLGSEPEHKTYLSIIKEDSNSAVGLANPFPTDIVQRTSRRHPHCTYPQCRGQSHGQPRKWMHPYGA